MVETVLSLNLLPTICEEETLLILALLSSDYTPIGDCQTPEEGLQYFLQKTISWLIMDGLTPVGLIALSPSQRHGTYYQTTTYIFPSHRGLHYNQKVKSIIAQSFLRNPHINLCSVVRDWNIRSQRAMAKSFPSVVPIQELRTEEQKQKDPTVHQWFYDLNQIPLRDIEPEEQEVYLTISEWVEAKFPSTEVNFELDVC